MTCSAYQTSLKSLESFLYTYQSLRTKIPPSTQAVKGSTNAYRVHGLAELYPSEFPLPSTLPPAHTEASSASRRANAQSHPPEPEDAGSSSNGGASAAQANSRPTQITNSRSRTHAKRNTFRRPTYYAGADSSDDEQMTAATKERKTILLLPFRQTDS
eukprot:6172416-Pleurochrysis_carterae.AAC.1